MYRIFRNTVLVQILCTSSEHGNASLFLFPSSTEMYLYKIKYISVAKQSVDLYTYVN